MGAAGPKSKSGSEGLEAASYPVGIFHAPGGISSKVSFASA
jgi:hypothetical protein